MISSNKVVCVKEFKVKKLGQIYLSYVPISRIQNVTQLIISFMTHGNHLLSLEFQTIIIFIY